MSAEAKTPVVPTPRKWVSDRTLAQYFEVDRSTIWEWAKIGKIPPPKKFSPRTNRWDIDAVVEQVLGIGKKSA